MADLWANEVAPSLHRIEFGYRADPTDKRGNPEKENARADGMWVYGGFGGYIEVKSTRGMSWDMRGWRDDQREWYQKWCVPQDTPLFIWLNIEGTSPPHTKMNTDKGKYPRKAWLIPANDLLVLHERQVELYGQHSMPYHATSGYSKDMQLAGWDAMHMLKKWELKWAGGGTWEVLPWSLLALAANKTRQTINRDVQFEE